MENLEETVKVTIEGAGWLAPFLFVILHVLRPVLLLPVIVVCLIGGLLFGIVWGAVLNFIGLALMTLVTYWLVGRFPKFKARLDRLKEKFVHGKTVTLGQVMLLRCMPFVHFQLLSVYVIEMTKSFRQYFLYSLVGVIGPAILYTAFGDLISELSLTQMLLIFAALALVYYGIHRFHKARIAAAD
ncbi:TVP38/TMEM64 family protein [Indiicoccus explosivorum]|uniref:TVP38/TMEM64 family protein n=1 Tax=Indiicoccus explosivorum TaxID=1917864 RepID=UPI000B44078E|nr:VTT domain-containing protein [Indiicoccus explosivorum]